MTLDALVEARHVDCAPAAPRRESAVTTRKAPQSMKTPQLVALLVAISATTACGGKIGATDSNPDAGSNVAGGNSSAVSIGGSGGSVSSTNRLGSAGNVNVTVGGSPMLAIGGAPVTGGSMSTGGMVATGAATQGGALNIGGNAGAGAMMATGGGVLVGTGGSPAPILCTGTPLASPIITDDAGVRSAAITGNPLLVYYDFTYAAPGLTQPTVTQILAGDGRLLGLHVLATPGTSSDPYNAWLGVGLALNGCVDASAYAGVRFTIAGDLGTCSLAFVAIPTEKQAVAYGGACTGASCWSPPSAPLAVGTSTVYFADLVGGVPDGPIDPSRLQGVQWQLTVPTDGSTAPCSATFNITDVAFVTN